MLQIPITLKEPHSSQETEVFGQIFNLEFEWIEREEFWVLHIYDLHRKPLAFGIRMQPKWPLFSHNGINFMLLEPNKLIAYEAL